MKDYVIAYMTYHTGRYFKMYLCIDNGDIITHSYKKENAKNISLIQAKNYLRRNNSNRNFDNMYFIENVSEYEEE